MKLRFVDDPPSAGTTTSALKRAVQLTTEHRTDVDVARPGPRRDIQRTVNDLGALTFGRGEVRLVELLATVSDRLDHRRSVALAQFVMRTMFVTTASALSSIIRPISASSTANISVAATLPPS